MMTRHLQIRQISCTILVLCISYVQSTMVSVDNIEVEKFTAADSKASRLANIYKPAKDNIASPASRQPANIIYGKSKPSRPVASPYIAPSVKGKTAKFKPSQEEISYDSDSFSQYAQGYKSTPQETAALQKYMQKYASQTYTAQKYAPILSEAQKHVVANDPYKKYVTPAPHKYKFVPIITQESKSPLEKVKEQDTVEIGTEKYPTYQLHQHVVVTPTKPTKSIPKKIYSFDSSQQSSDYKYASHEGLNSQLVGTQEKDSWSSYEPYQSFGHYGIVTPEKGAEYSKITGYKIPAASSVSHGHSEDSHGDEKGHEEEHYPHHDPKYEYMYQVHDPEKHNNFGHSEARKGKQTWGRYYVLLPDGRLETVKYWVDKSGYHAEVDFKGQAKHPSYKEYTKEYTKHEETPKSTSYGKTEDLGLGGHSETSYSIGEGSEEY